MSRFEALFGDDADVLDESSFRALLVASFISPLGTAVVSPILDSLTDVFGVGEARIGLLVAAFTAPAILLIPVVGALSDRVGRRPVLAAGLALFGLAGSAVAFTDEFRVVLALRLIQGVGYCGIGPILITAVGDRYAGQREAAAQGVRFTVVGVALTVAPLLAGGLVVLAWQYPFLLYALALPAAVTVVLFLDEPRSSDASAASGGVRELLALVRHPRVLVTVLGRAVPSFVWFVFLTYASIVVVTLLAGSPAAAGVVVAVASLGSALGGTQVGRLTDAFDGRRVPLFVAVAACAAGLAGLSLAPSVPAAGVSAGVVGSGLGVALSLYRSEMTRLAPERRRGGLVSVGESVGRVGSTAAPVVCGALVTAARPSLGFDGAVRSTLFVVAAAAFVAGGACVVGATRLSAPSGSPAAE